MRRIFMLGLLVMLTVLTSSFVIAQDAPTAYFRFAHNAPGIDGVSLFVNDSATEIQGTVYRDVSEWYRLRADTAFTFAAGRDGSDPIWTVTKRLAADSYTTLTLSVGATDRPTLSARNAVAHVRVAHLAQGTGAIDAFVNDELSTVQALSFGQISDWVSLPVGVTRFGVGATGSDPRYNVTGNLSGDTWNTIVAVGSSDAARANLRIISEDYGVLDTNAARVTVFHAIPGALPVNVVVDGSTYIQNLAFPGTLGNNDGVDTFEIAAGAHSISVVSTLDPTQTVLSLNNTALLGNRAYFIAAYGLAGTPQLLLDNTDALTIASS